MIIDYGLSELNCKEMTNVNRALRLTPAPHNAVRIRVFKTLAST